MRTILSRVASLFRRQQLDCELRDELAAHLAMQEEEFRNRGFSAADAHAAALREFGGVSRTIETYREQRGLPRLESFLRDLRYATRALIHNPGFTAAAVLSLALGIGANTAIFSLFHALMLRALPVAHPEQLVTLYRTGGWGVGFSSYPLYEAFANRTDLFTDVVAAGNVNPGRFRYKSQGGGETVQYSLVSGNYFSALGISSAAGRLFRNADNDTPHAHPLAVLSYDFWLNRFGGDPTVIGQTIVVDNDPLTVIGVAASGFHGINVDRRADLWEPTMMRHGDVRDVGSNWLWIVARLRPGLDRERAQAASSVLFQRYLFEHYGNLKNAGFRRMALDQHIAVRDGDVGISMLRESFGKALTVLLTAVAMVLLAACANIANLSLARGAYRRKEYAVRLSLGATRARLIRQSFAESCLLGCSGCALGFVLAYWGARAITLFLPLTEGNPFASRPSEAVLLFALAASLISILLFGLAPAWRSAGVDAYDAMKSGAGNATPHNAGLHNLLVVAQVAFSVMLVAVAALFSHSLSALRSVDIGFRNTGLISAPLDFPDTWTMDQKASAEERVVGRIAAIPGVTRVAFGSPGPFLGGFANHTIHRPGSDESVVVNVQRISPAYFESLGTRLLQGREFDSHDTTGSRKVAMVNRAFLRKLLPNEPRPLDQSIDFERGKDDLRSIVGIVPDIPHQGLRSQVEPTVYLPLAQDRVGFGELLVETPRSITEIAPLLRREIMSLGADVRGADPTTIRRTIDESIFEDRLVAAVSGFFGLLALALAAVGLYGVLTYTAARRLREIGIRIALGAAREQVLWNVVRNPSCW